MAVTFVRVAQIANKIRNFARIRPSHLPNIGYISACRTLCSDPSNQDDGKIKKLDLAKPRDRRKEKEERRLESEKSKELGINSDILKAAESVAQSLGGDVKQTQSDLLQQLQAHANKTETEDVEKIEAKTLSMGDLLSSMKFEKPGLRRRGIPRKKKEETSSSSSEDEDFPKRQTAYKAKDEEDYDRSFFREGHSRPSLSLFKGPRLNIFNKEKDMVGEQSKSVDVVASNPLFDEADRADLHRLSSAPPSNAFEEMIQWTKEGKLWNFPIDNEQGMDEEKRIGFHEHVFLEHHLEEFPETPSIQHFMELVTTGLSQNPYLTVGQKVEHINWFRDYFNNKKHLLEDDSVKTAGEIKA